MKKTMDVLADICVLPDLICIAHDLEVIEEELTSVKDECVKSTEYVLAAKYRDWVSTIQDIRKQMESDIFD